MIGDQSRAPANLPSPLDPPSGWHALLELAYERRGGRTVPSLRRHVGPLRIQKHFEPEPALCEHVIVHPPAGIVGGDRLAIDVTVGAEAMTRLTTPGATRWYRSAGPQATSRLTRAGRAGGGRRARVAAAGDDRVRRRAGALGTRFELAPEASLIAWDITTLGRKAGQQPFAHGTWRTRIDITRAERGGRLLYSARWPPTRRTRCASRRWGSAARTCSRRSSPRRRTC